MSAGFTNEGRAAVARSAGATIFGDCIPLLANMNAASHLPTELLGDALLAVQRDWLIQPARFAVLAVIKVEQANAAIVERHRIADEAAKPKRRRR